MISNNALLDIACAAHVRVYRGTCTSPDRGFFLSDHASLQV